MVFNTYIWEFPSHPQNMFNIFPQFSRLEDITFIKSQYGNFAITIEAVPFYLDWWFYIILYHTHTNMEKVRARSEAT